MPYDIYIGRAMYQGGWRLPASKWANPFRVKDYGGDEASGRAQAIAAFEAHVRASPELMAALPELRGKRLGCWCSGKGLPCHGDVLVKLLAELDGARAESPAPAAPLTHILVSGARDWPEDKSGVIDDFFAEAAARGRFALIEGECRGADLIARRAAERLGMAVIRMPAQWDRYGKGAGPKRNSEMLDLLLARRKAGDPVEMVFFHESLASSAGTRDAVTKARAKGLNPIDGAAWHRARVAASNAVSAGPQKDTSDPLVADSDPLWADLGLA